MRALVDEAISLDAVDAVKLGFGVYRYEKIPPSELRPSGSELKLAAQHNSVRAAQVIIECGSSCVTAADIDDAFVVAAQHDNVAMMKLLIKHGGDTFTAAVEQAAAHKRVAALRFLSKYSSKEEISAAILRHDDQDVLRHVAAEIKHELFLAEVDLGQAIVTDATVEEVGRLLSKGVDINSMGMSGDFPLALAALLGKWEFSGHTHRRGG